MSEEQKPEFKIKPFNTELGKILPFVIQMTEEVAEKGFYPYCVIGIGSPDKETKIVQTLFATVSDDDLTMNIITNSCKALLLLKGYKVIKTKTKNK